MVNHEPSDATSSRIPMVPKRKRQASCLLDEQERRERKRAMDREAQRSLREKTKTRIADLERTIEILREKDCDSATARLMSENDALRAENERLKQVIDNVRSLVGCNIAPPNIASTNAANGKRGGESEDGSPAGTNVGSSSPKPFTAFANRNTKSWPLADVTQPVSTEYQISTIEQPVSVGQPTPIQKPIYYNQSSTAESIDLDGMTVMTNADEPGVSDADKPAIPHVNDDTNSSLGLQPSTRSVKEQEQLFNIERSTTFMAMLHESFGPDWRSPPPTILHIGNPSAIPPPVPSTPICPMWTKVCDTLGRIFTYRAHMRAHKTLSSHQASHETTEAGLLYLGIKQGWDCIPSPEWQHYPALEVVKEVDGLVFSQLPKIERLAIGYKCLKLLTYYLNATKHHLDRVPVWLRPNSSQASTNHPIIIDFFAWPSLRSRFLSHHTQLSRSRALACYYPSCLRFDWPFAFDDTFFRDEASGTYAPSPLFEMYSSDLSHWMMEEKFYETFPEMRADIEGDRAVYAHV